MKDSGFITATSFPTLVGLNIDWPYKIGESGAAQQLGEKGRGAAAGSLCMPCVTSIFLNSKFASFATPLTYRGPWMAFHTHLGCALQST